MCVGSGGACSSLILGNISSDLGKEGGNISTSGRVWKNTRQVQRVCVLLAVVVLEHRY